MYFTYFTVTSIIIVMQVGLLAAYLLFLKDKSRPTLYLGIAFLNLVFFLSAYIFAYTVLDPIGTYHRIFTVLFVLPALGYFSVFMHTFPQVHFHREYNIIKWAIPGISIVNWLYFVFEIIDQRPYFVFSGHFYNFNAGFVTSIVILAFLIYFVIISIRKIKVTQGRDQQAIKKLLGAIIFVVLAPAITNVLNLKGIIEREVHQTIFTITNVIGYFVIAVVYINHTIDRSTFMIKIVGVSVLLLLVMFLSIAMFIIPRQDKHITVLQKNHARTAVRAHQIHDSIQYIAKEENGAYHVEYTLPGIHIEPPTLLPNSITCHLRDKAGNIRDNLSIDKIKHLTGADHPDSLGRIWRCDAKNPNKFYLAYHIRGNDGNMYEVGFQYEEYRSAINEVSQYLAYLALLVIVATVLGLPFFFKVSLVEPLDFLLQGLKEIHKGNLDIQLEVQIQDEIGFLTESFNSMVSSIREAQAKLREYADELEEKVKERTKELAQTLEEVQALKRQQDGDYYLTQLLIAPLGSNAAQDENLKIDFLVKQKKSFQFRKWQADLGGDICISHNIDLMGKKYIVFLNGDAMGKSMQGAGGALVLGAVFQSIIERTKLSNEIKSRSPERWLKNTYQELQKVFETFDGSMLVSVILGLVEVDTGLLLWFNAEHPWLVLYRDGVAQFLEDDLHLRKLGTKGLPSIFTVKTLRLHAGDVIFGGSDGKDDTAILDPETGERIINEDETKILQFVESTQCNLKAIFEDLQKNQELTDDISMFRVEFTPKTEPLQQQTHQQELKKLQILIKENMLEDALRLAQSLLSSGDQSPALLKQAAKLALKQKQYAEALQFVGLYLEKHPEENDFLFYASYCAKMLGHLDLAADYGERLALRNPLYIKNLINLIDIYLLLKVFSRAQELLEQAKTIEPDNPKIKQLEQKLQTALNSL